MRTRFTLACLTAVALTGCGSDELNETRDSVADVEEPGDDQHRDGCCKAKQHEACREQQVGHRQHRPAADQIDLAPDPGGEQGGKDLRGGEGGKNPVRRDAEVAPDGVGKDRRQIVTRCPCQRLGRAERHNERKLASVHGSPYRSGRAAAP